MAAVTESIAEVAESVAEDALAVAEVSRSLSVRDFSLGFGSGVVVVGLIAWFGLRRHFETKYDKIAEDEIDKMREYYRSRMVAVTERVEKPQLEDIVREQGYVPPPPGEMNVVRENPVPEALMEDLNKPSPEIAPDMPEWDYQTEYKRRSTDFPYVIHKDEFEEHREMVAKTQVTYTYYNIDDVVADESDRPVENWQDVIGEYNLTKFGYGSDDPNVVYLCNEKLDLDIELIRNPGSFAQEVLGFAPPTGNDT